MTRKWTISGIKANYMSLKLFFLLLRLTPLHHLAMRGNLSMVNLLLDRQRLLPIWRLSKEPPGSVDATDHQVKPFLIKIVDNQDCV